MKNKPKIILIILFQIFFIFSSFFVLGLLESQISLQGNSVNVAGKNRFLASQFLDEVKDWAYVKNPESSPDKALKDLEDNIYLLKNGGVSTNLKIEKLQNEFQEDWIKINNNLLTVKTQFLEFKSQRNLNLDYVDIMDLEISTLLLVQSSDNLVTKLSSNLEKKSEFIVFLNYMLLTLNVIIHVFLIWIILGISQKESEQNKKTEKLITIGELSARIAHDLRTPLSNINLGIQLLKNKIKDPYDLEKINSIETAVGRISHQVNDVMDFVKTREPNLMVWNLNAIIKDSIKKISIPDKIEMSFPNKDLAIKCDKEQFEILFINLILNAIDAIDQNGTIKISAQQLSEKFLIEIIDSGKGIPEEFLENIFDPLFTLKEKGTGLGLASCKNIVESHGGTISVSQNPTTFKILLPYHKN